MYTEWGELACVCTHDTVENEMVRTFWLEAIISTATC